MSEINEPAPILEDLVDRAQLLEVAYEIRQDELAELAKPVGEQLAALVAAMEAFGGKRPPLKEIAGRAESLEGPFLKALQDAISVLDDARLLQTLASILAASAARLVSLRVVNGHAPVPAVFEAGDDTL